MRYNEREQWILSEGCWYGMAVCILSFGVTILFIPEFTLMTGVLAILAGLIFVLIGHACEKNAESPWMSNK